MTRLEAIENTNNEISSLENFLTAVDRKHEINIVDPGWSEETLTTLVCACEEAKVWLQKEANKEEEGNTLTLEEKYKDLCLRNGMF